MTSPSTPHARLAALLALVTGFGLVLTAFVTPAGAAGADGQPTTLTIRAGSAYADTAAAVVTRLEAADGTGVAGAAISLERRVRGAWQAVATATSDSDGSARFGVRLSRVAADNVVRASYAGDPTYAAATPVQLGAPLRRRTSALGLSAPAQVVAGRKATIVVTWRTASGSAVAGPVRLLRRGSSGGWKLERALRTGSDGRASAKVTLRGAVRWRATAAALDWVGSARSETRTTRLRPPGDPVRLPSGAPRPRITLPAQPPAVGRGANPVITTIPDDVWGSMVGRSWHSGCPVGREGLRLLRINYWGFDGYRHRGELVASAAAVSKMSSALAAMSKASLPIRAMYRVDRFGYSAKVQGADDYASMAADNTSAFNCRSVVGKPGVRSPHSYGGALDVNPWENPYRSRTGTVPNTWWPSHSHPRVAWRSSSHPVVRAMTGHGMRWTYGLSDIHHFDAVGGRGREIALSPGCRRIACD